MTESEIHTHLHSEELIFHLKKRTERNVAEGFLWHLPSILSWMYFARRKKFDTLIITKKFLYKRVASQIKLNVDFENIKNLKFNSASEELQVYDLKENHTFCLKDLRLTYKETQKLKRKILEFNENDLTS